MAGFARCDKPKPKQQQQSAVTAAAAQPSISGIQPRSSSDAHQLKSDERKQVQSAQQSIHQAAPPSSAVASSLLPQLSLQPNPTALPQQHPTIRADTDAHDERKGNKSDSDGEGSEDGDGDGYLLSRDELLAIQTLKDDHDARLAELNAMRDECDKLRATIERMRRREEKEEAERVKEAAR